MSLIAAVTCTTCDVAGGNQNIVTADLGGLTPKAAILGVTRGTAFGTAADHAVLGFGAVTGAANRLAACISAEHGQASTDTYRRAATDECLLILNPTDGSVDGEADFNSWITNGMTITWGNAPSAAFLLWAVFLAGTDLSAQAATFTAAAAIGGVTDVNTVGFRPDIVLTWTIGDTFADTSWTHGIMTHGVAVNKDPVVQANWNVWLVDGAASGDPQAEITDAYATGQHNTWDGEIGDFDSQGFSCTTRTGASGSDVVGFLALSLGGAVDFAAGVIDSPIANGDASWNDPGFTPQIIYQGLTQITAVNTRRLNDEAGSFGVSAFDADDQHSLSVQDEDGSATTDTQSLTDDAAINLPDDDGAAAWAATFRAFTDLGWMLNFTGSKGTAVKWWFWAVEQYVAPAPARITAVALRRHELFLTNDAGLRLADSDGRNPLATFLWLRASRVANGIGWIDVGVPRSFDSDLFLKRDFMMQFWRMPKDGVLSLWRAYFLRKWRFETFEGVESLVLSGPCVNELLRRRPVVAYSGSPEASKTDFADDMMKELVTEAQSDSVAPVPAAGTRAWGQLSVAADLGAAPSISKSMAFAGPLLSYSGGGVLPAIARASRIAGTDLFFDIIASSVSASAINLEFRTYTGQLGQDLSDHVLFDEAKGNMGNAFYEYNASKERNYVYGAGQGEGSARNIQQVYDADRYNASIWNRCEAVADARNEGTDNGVREKARDLLREGEPVERFGATPKDTEETKFGIHWNFGDRVKARYKRMEFISVINSVVLSVNRVGEQVAARLDYASDV